MDAFINAVHSGLIGDYVAVVLEDLFRGKLVAGMEEEVVGFSARESWTSIAGEKTCASFASRA